jgi:hypothetical protein
LMNICLIIIGVLNVTKCNCENSKLMFHLNLLLFKWISVFVESLESLSENRNLSFNVDAGCFQILNPTKSSDQLKYTILLKLALLELPCCSIVLSYLSQHTLNTWVWLFLDTNKMDLLRNKAVLYSTDL